MAGTIKVGGNIIATHTGVEGAGTVQIQNSVLHESSLPTNVAIVNRRFKKDGLTKANYARSAEDILEHYPNSANGYYYICPLQDNIPMHVYCDMTGGGWMQIHCRKTQDSSGNTQQTNSIDFRNIYFASATHLGYHVTTSSESTSSYLPSVTDPNGSFRSSGYNAHEGFYTRSGNNSYNSSYVHFFDHTRVLGTPSNPCAYRDWQVEAHLGYAWGWSGFYISEYPKQTQVDANGAPTKHRTTTISFYNNSSNNMWAMDITANGSNSWLQSGNGSGFGNFHSMEKIGTSAKGWKDAQVSLTSAAATVSGTVPNYYGVLTNVFQSPSCVEFIYIRVKNLYSGEL
tara:strand:- start:306 stop:1331 length:1026 start_codon:yes stop_codon:yes gene_type:complete